MANSGDTNSKVTVIDGGMLEGGGQILRMAVAFSALLRKPIRVHNIRAGRSKPGLRAQHLKGLELVRDICGARLEGAVMGSTEVSLYPGKIKSGNFHADTETAGSVMLLFQVALPCLLFSDGKSQLVLQGGTNAEMAPQIDYTLMIFKPIAEKFGVHFDCDIIKRGYYPKGGGKVIVRTSPVSPHLHPVEMLDRGHLVSITGRSFTAGALPIKVAHIMADSASSLCRQYFPGIQLNISRVKEDPNAAVGTGSGIVIMAETSTGCKIGGEALGKRGIQAEEVGEAAAKELKTNVDEGGCVDRHLQDQLIILMALAKGTSRIRSGPVTLHTETAIHVAQMLTEAKFNITKDENQESCVIECQGIGLSRS